MKKAIGIIVSLLFVLAVAGVSVAAEKAMGKSESAAPASTEKQASMEKVELVVGEVAAIDTNTGTLTVKSKKHEISFATDGKTIIKMGKENKSLADIKSGDKVKVKYTEANGKKLARSIAVKTPMTATK